MSTFDDFWMWIPEDKFYHICIIYGEDTEEIYLDGKSVSKSKGFGGPWGG